MQIAENYLGLERAHAQEQQQLLPAHSTEARPVHALGKEAARRSLEPRHRAAFTRARQPSRKTAKVGRRSAKAGRKASR